MVNSLIWSFLSDYGDVLKFFFKLLVLIVVREKKIVFFWNMEYDDIFVKVDNYELFVC